MRYPASSMLRRMLTLGLLAGLPVAPASAQEDTPVEEEKGHVFGVELKAHYRDSDEAMFAVRTPFDPIELPVGAESAFLETVEAGEHFEVSTATVFYRGSWGERWHAKAKIDLIDRHDRNSTSEAREYDIDELWVAWGHELEPGDLHEERFSGYVKLGKFPKFERQNDRHLESYGLISTASNRAEDIGLEVGVDIGRYFYAKGSITQGNPVFIRDPNALAGDNGTSLFDGSVPNPDPELKSGIPILYDADIDDIDFDNPEGGLALGLRLGDGGLWSLDLMAFRYIRELADTVELDGTFYGGDLDILFGPFNALPLFPITGREKEEWGLTAWFYFGGLSIFAQYIDQDIGGLVRDGFEVEVSYDIELPYWGALWGRQVLPYIAPAIRYSEIDPQFGSDPRNPAISVIWDWEKIDIGLRLGLLQGVADMTLEYNDNEFIRGGRAESADEFLATLRLNWDWRLVD